MESLFLTFYQILQSCITLLWFILESYLFGRHFFPLELCDFPFFLHSSWGNLVLSYLPTYSILFFWSHSSLQKRLNSEVDLLLSKPLVGLASWAPRAALRFSSVISYSVQVSPWFFWSTSSKSFLRKAASLPFCFYEWFCSACILAWQVTVVQLLFFLRLKWILTKNFGIALFYSSIGSCL